MNIKRPTNEAETAERLDDEVEFEGIEVGELEAIVETVPTSRQSEQLLSEPNSLGSHICDANPDRKYQDLRYLEG